MAVAAPARAAGPSLGSGNNDLGDVALSSATVVNNALGSGSELVAADFPATTIRAVVTASAGEVSLTTTTGLTAPTGYPAGFAGPSIAFFGSVGDVNAALASMVYTAAATPGSATIDVAAAVDSPGVAYNPDNGHYYQFVNPATDLTWDEARAAALELSFNEMNGYLATITTQAENDFVTDKTGGAQAWIGGSDLAEETQWRWMDGPEAGDLFWIPSCGTALRGICEATDMFNQWSTAEPNDTGSNEDALQIVAGGNGWWNDLPRASDRLPYIVEYSTPSGEPNPALAATRSLDVTVALPPGTPTELTPQAGDRKVGLAWTAPESQSPITDYHLQYRDQGGAWERWPHGSSKLSATVTGLMNQTTYDFRVAAISAAGTGPFSAVVKATPLGVPGAPQGITVTPRSGQITCTWRAPASQSAVTGYIVQYAPAGGAWITWPHATLATSATITGLRNGTTYRCRVAARSAAGTGPFSTAKQATPLAPPAAPSQPSAEGHDGKVVFRWHAPTSGSPITNYVVQYATQTGPWQVWPHGSITTAATITGLANGTKHRFRVAAVSAMGTGPFSAVVTATPKRRATTQAPVLAKVPRKVGSLTWLKVIRKQGNPAAALRSATPKACVAIEGRVYFLYRGRCKLTVVQDGKVVSTVRVKVSPSAKAAGAKRQRITKVHFRGDSATLTRAAKRKLLRVVPELRGRDPVMVLGNAADATGTKDSREARRLSRMRAAAVADFLRTHDVTVVEVLFFSKKYARGLRNPSDRRVDVTSR